MKTDFDIASKQYDTTFTFSNIGKAQRHMVFKYLKPILNQGKVLSILELNCGTGADAIHFGDLGHRVTATDISEGMICRAKAKVYPKNVSFKTQDINSLDTQSFDKKFDLIFSNFGGFNCLSKRQLESFFNKTKDLLDTNGKLVMVIMPKQCLWEWLYFTLKGDFSKAKRRQTSEAIVANVDGVNVKTWYYNPEEIVSLAETLYTKKRIRPIGIAIPPSYLENSFLAKPPCLSILKRIDTMLKGAFWAKYADHFLIELIKK
jgi:ubiquinone/menaquinone biosynthesis C-methylase UbiE